MRDKRDSGARLERVNLQAEFYKIRPNHSRTKMPIRTLSTAVIATPLYAATYYKMHGDGSDTLKYEPALLASALVVGMNFHHAVSSAKTVPTVGVIAAAGVGMYYFKSWRYTRAYLGKDWKAYFR